MIDCEHLNLISEQPATSVAEEQAAVASPKHEAQQPVTATDEVDKGITTPAL